MIALCRAPRWVAASAITLASACCAPIPQTIEFVVVTKDTSSTLDSVSVVTPRTTVPLVPMHERGSFQGVVERSPSNAYRLDAVVGGRNVTVGSCTVRQLPRGPIVVLVHDVASGSLECVEGGS